MRTQNKKFFKSREIIVQDPEGKIYSSITLHLNTLNCVVSKVSYKLENLFSTLILLNLELIVFEKMFKTEAQKFVTSHDMDNLGTTIVSTYHSNFWWIPPSFSHLSLWDSTQIFHILWYWNRKTTAKLYASVALQRSTCCLIRAVLCVEFKISTTKQHQLHLAANLSQDRNHGAESQTAQRLSIKVLFLLRLITKNEKYFQVYSFLHCQFNKLLASEVGL